MKRCALCPRRCGAERPETGLSSQGFCRMPLTPMIARAGLHFWEEPVISGTRGSGTVFFSGCNLHCVYCQNYDISTCDKGKEVSVERLLAIYKELAEQGAHNINLVTPSHFLEAVLESLEPPPPLPVVYNTNGYDSVASLRRLEGKVQIYLPDLKYADAEAAARYSAAPDYFETACCAIDEMVRQTGPFEIGDDGIMKRGTIIRHLVLPGMVENSLKVIRYVAEHFDKDAVCFSLMQQYLPCGRVSETEYPELNRRVTKGEYRRVEQALFDSGIENGFVQSGKAAKKEFIPCFDGSGV